MKRVVSRVALVLGAASLSAGCSGDKDRNGGPGDNPIDAVLAPLFEADGFTPVAASNAEICRRLSADLLGRYATADEVEQDCKGRPVGEIARRFQSRADYLLTSERHWRDRLDSNDVTQDWRYLKEVYERVDDLHRGDLRYDDFVLEVSSHPGFMMGMFEPAEKAALAIRAFLGRAASDAEAADLASLYRVWLPAGVVDPDFAYTYRIQARVLPVLCEPLTSCTSVLMGGGALDMSVFNDPTYQGIAFEDFTAAQLSAMQEPGRVLVRQPELWEAAADEILNRLLAWSDGGRFPREPGIVLPEVREVLADFLRETGDYPAAERLVITSWLYRQAAEVPADGYGDDPLAPVPPIYHHGPVKPALAETWLNSTRPIVGIDFGTCDPRYTDGFPYFLLVQAYDEGLIGANQLYTDLEKLHGMMGDRRLWDAESGYPDFVYDYLGRLIGGCPGFASRRQPQTGLSYAFTQETLAELLCSPGIAAGLGADSEIADILRTQMRITLGRNPTSEETAAFEAAAAGCSGAECAPINLRNSVCVGLLGSAPMIFY